MTVYVRAAPSPSGAWYLWADDPDEALTAAAYAGANVLTAHRPERAAGHYDLTTGEWAQALANGAEVRPLLDAWTHAARARDRPDLLTKSCLDHFAGRP